jgi:cytoskeletal protein RodZ
MASPAQPPAGGGGKVLGLKPRTAIIAGGVILAAAIGYFLWKRHQAPATPATTSASASSSTSGIDYGGELSVIQSELEDLLAAEGQSGASTTGSGSTTATGTGTSTTGTGTATATAPATAKVPPMPANVRATAETASTVSLTWTPSAGATSYGIRVTYQDKLVEAGTASGTSRVVNGLKPNQTYTFHVKACNSAGCSAETNGPAVKTKL